MHDFWAISRIFIYLLVVVLSFGILKRKLCYVLFGNIVLASFLMMNAINYILGVRDTLAFQIVFTIVLIFWAITHLLGLLRKE
jgi:hypothetical protein